MFVLRKYSKFRVIGHEEWITLHESLVFVLDHVSRNADIVCGTFIQSENANCRWLWVECHMGDLVEK